MRTRKTLIVLLMALLLGSPVYVAQAQDGATTPMPDLIGLSVPAAAAQLNAVGLALGPQADEPWTETAAQPANTISAQAVPPGQAVAAGTAVGVTVLRSPNTLLLYDVDSITLINQTGGALDLNGLVFTALDGSPAASFPATNWLPNLPAHDCAQLWAIRRTGPARPGECEAIQRWLSTVNPAAHFWTAANGVIRFSVSYGGVERTVCEAAQRDAGQQRCMFFLPADTTAADVTEYLYFAYTADHLIILNQSQDRWMALGGSKVYNYNANLTFPGAEIPLGDAGLYAMLNPAANTERLAPGQCLYFTRGQPEASTPPQPCAMIARLDIDPDLIFWAADFEVGSVTDGQRRTCPAASLDRLTLCIMPR